MKKTDFLVGVLCGGLIVGIAGKISKSKKFEQNRQAIKEEAEKLYKVCVESYNDAQEENFNGMVIEEESKEKTEQEIIDEKILEIKAKVLNSRAR